MIKNFNEITKDKLSFFIIILLVILILQLFETFKKINNIISFNYNERVAKNYEYCGGESLGFLNFLKNKYPDLGNVEIKNFFISPNSEWFFKDYTTEKYTSNRLVVLGYDDLNKISFDILNKNSFLSQKSFKTLNKLEKISFDIFELDKDQNVEISIFSEMYGQTKLITKKKSKIVKGYNEIVLNNKEIEDIFYNGKILVRMSSELQKEINFKNLNLTQSHLINLNKFEILENYENCFLLGNK